MRDSDLRSAPPVPPRRLKRKTKPTEVVTEVATSPVLRSERRSRLPPPPPPPTPPYRVPIGQRIRPAEIPPARISGKISPRRSFDVSNSRLSINGEKHDADDVDLRPSLSSFGTSLCLPLSRNNSAEKSSTRESPRRNSKERARISRPNEYPPLFFTLQDFQEVMADVDNSYSRTLRNMTSFEPTPRPRRPRDTLGEVAVTELPETPKGQVLFRVTTTNVPFEKCLPGWSDSGNDPNHFIFEDYVDRRQFPAPRREAASRKLVLFGDDTFDRDEEEPSASSTRSTTRVRFLIDSPGEEDAAEKTADFDSLQNIDSLPPDEDDVDVSGAPGAETKVEKITEDEFGDVPFNSLLNSAGSSLQADPSEDSTSSRTDFQTILVTATVEKIPEPEKPRQDEVEGVKPSGEDRRVNSSMNGDEKVRGKEAAGRKDTDEKLLEVSGVNPCAKHQTCDKSPLVKERRNSFLMNMLRAEDAEEKVVCKVVATHPKTPIRGCMVRGEEMRPSAVVEAKSKLLGELSSSFSAARLKPRPINVVENILGRSGEVEDEGEIDSAETLSGDLDSVLLDSNVVKCNKISEEPIEEKKSNILRKEPRTSSDYVCSQKTDQFIDKKKNNNKYLHDRIVIGGLIDNTEEDLVNGEKNIGQNNGANLKKSNDKKNQNDDKVAGRGGMNIMNKIDDYKVDVASRSSVDKCAIVRRCNDINIDDINDDNNNNNNNNSNNNNNNIINNNNNDNNAMTPVDLSYDQSRKVLSIIPGSVRSFVKFYEIRGETNVVGSNVSEDHQKIPKIMVEEILESENNVVTDNCEENNSNNRPTKYPAEIENDIKYTIVARKEIRKQVNPTAHDQKPIVNQRTDRFTDKSGGIITNETRLSQPPLISVKHRAKNEWIGTERGREYATKSSPSSKKAATRIAPKSPNAAPEIVPEKKDGSTAGKTRDIVMSSAENQLIPKSSSTATFDGRYTFYCTV